MTSDRTTTLTPTNLARARIPKKRPTRSFWMKTLTEFSQSGLSVQQFCRLKTLSPSNFYTWRKRLREEEAHTSPAPSSFIPLELMPADGSPNPSKDSLQTRQADFSSDAARGGNYSGLTLHVNNNLKISINKDFHSATLQRLVKLLSLGNCSPC